MAYEILPILVGSEMCIGDRCAAPAAAQWERFLAVYRRRGVARISLDTRILGADDSEAVRFSGQYVLQR